MSVTVNRAAFEHSRSRGTTRLLLLAYASFASEEKVKRGEPAIAFPAQSTLAKLCNCSRSTVQIHIDRLVELGEIEDTGNRHSWDQYRSTIEYEILPGFNFAENCWGTD